MRDGIRGRRGKKINNPWIATYLVNVDYWEFEGELGGEGAVGFHGTKPVVVGHGAWWCLVLCFKG